MTRWIHLIALFATSTALYGAHADAAPTPAHATAIASSARTADATARDFYSWYVGLMAHDKEPGDDQASYTRYVSNALRASIARQMASPDGMDVDYFIKTQDYLDEWIGHIAATPAANAGAAARTTVTLGTGGKAWRLAVSLVREDGRWKIARVTRA